MPAKLILTSLFALSVVCFLPLKTSAQGGWRQWNVYLRDGSQVEANPLQMRADGRFTRSMDPKDPGIERSKISYLAIARTTLPPAPDGDFEKDLVVMLDGTRTFGAVTFRNLKFSEGTILQNGKEMTLEKVAYIKFAHPQKKKSNPKRRTR